MTQKYIHLGDIIEYTRDNNNESNKLNYGFVVGITEFATSVIVNKLNSKTIERVQLDNISALYQRNEYHN